MCTTMPKIKTLANGNIKGSVLRHDGGTPPGCYGASYLSPTESDSSSGEQFFSQSQVNTDVIWQAASPILQGKNNSKDDNFSDDKIGELIQKLSSQHSSSHYNSNGDTPPLLKKWKPFQNDIITEEESLPIPKLKFKKTQLHSHKNAKQCKKIFDRLTAALNRNSQIKIKENNIHNEMLDDSFNFHDDSLELFSQMIESKMDVNTCEPERCVKLNENSIGDKITEGSLCFSSPTEFDRSCEDLWTDEDLFDDESFIIQATQVAVKEKQYQSSTPQRKAVFDKVSYTEAFCNDNKNNAQMKISNTFKKPIQSPIPVKIAKSHSSSNICHSNPIYSSNASLVTNIHQSSTSLNINSNCNTILTNSSNTDNHLNINSCKDSLVNSKKNVITHVSKDLQSDSMQITKFDLKEFNNAENTSSPNRTFSKSSKVSPCTPNMFDMSLSDDILVGLADLDESLDANLCTSPPTFQESKTHTPQLHSDITDTLPISNVFNDADSDDMWTNDDTNSSASDDLMDMTKQSNYIDSIRCSQEEIEKKKQAALKKRKLKLKR